MIDDVEFSQLNNIIFTLKKQDFEFFALKKLNILIFEDGKFSLKIKNVSYKSCIS